MLSFDLLTIFPSIFDSYFGESILRRAQEKKKIKISVHNVRDYTRDKHKTVDDRPYGGGPGMVLKIEPVYEALRHIIGEEELTKRVKRGKKTVQSKTRIILTDPDGKVFSQTEAERLGQYENLVIICGHYEGVDARVEKMVDERISIGGYIITGGELAAMVIADSIARLIPGVLGNPQSLTNGSHHGRNTRKKNNFDYPHYTRPEIFSPDGKTEWKVPGVLLSGNHKQIEAWRGKHVRKI